MLNELLSLEKRLFMHKYISDKNWLDNTIHEDFLECGKSGLIYNKKGTMEFLLSCTEDRDIKIYNFEYKKIDYNTYLIHYITKANNEELYYRTSVWVMDKNLKLLYHQATKLNIVVNLAEF